MSSLGAELVIVFANIVSEVVDVIVNSCPKAVPEIRNRAVKSNCFSIIYIYFVVRLDCQDKIRPEESQTQMDKCREVNPFCRI